MSLRLLLSTFLIAASAACATTAGTDWYAIGTAEGRLGVGWRDDYLESRFSTPADRESYRRGWEAGYAQRPMQVW